MVVGTTFLSALWPCNLKYSFVLCLIFYLIMTSFILWICCYFYLMSWRNVSHCKFECFIAYSRTAYACMHLLLYESVVISILCLKVIWALIIWMFIAYSRTAYTCMHASGSIFHIWIKQVSLIIHYGWSHLC